MTTKILSAIAILGIAGTAYFGYQSCDYSERLKKLENAANMDGQNADINDPQHNTDVRVARLNQDLENANADIAYWKQLSENHQNELERYKNLQILFESGSGTSEDHPPNQAVSNPANHGNSTPTANPDSIISIEFTPENKKALARALFASKFSEQKEALKQLGIVFSNEDFTEQMDTLIEQKDWKKYGEMQKILKLWAETDPRVATEWAMRLPESHWQEQILGTISSQWSKSEPDAVAGWLGTLNPGRGRDIAIMRYAQTISEKNPDNAVGWIATIQNENYRNSAEQVLASNWLRIDIEAAKAWIPGSSMSEANKNRFLKWIPGSYRKKEQ